MQAEWRKGKGRPQSEVFDRSLVTLDNLLAFTAIFYFGSGLIVFCDGGMIGL